MGRVDHAADSSARQRCAHCTRCHRPATANKPALRLEPHCWLTERPSGFCWNCSTVTRTLQEIAWEWIEKARIPTEFLPKLKADAVELRRKRVATAKAERGK